jgi:GntR family transcriptional regulator, transcriptional repressor for pyruvate dehydrogenase complex
MTNSNSADRSEQKANSRLHQQLMHRVLTDMTAGVYPAGERLPPEMELAGELRVSRGVVRELLRALADRDVVAIHHGRGSWVNPTSEWDLLDGDVLAALMPTPASVSVLTHYLECRHILETEAAALAAMRASSKDLSKMADAIAAMAELAVTSQTDAEADQRFHEADIAFHSAIFGATGNQVLPRVVAPIQRAMATLRPQLALHPEDRVQKTVPQHKAILEAIADADSEGARAAMSAHLASIEEYLREYRLEMNTKEQRVTR